MRYRRGLSTVVGAVFFIIATTTVVTYITYSMNSIDNFSQSVIVSESQNIDRGRESITISQVSIDGLKFNMTVTNTGSLPVKLTRLWVTNQDGVTADQKADLNIQLNPGQQQYDIGQSAEITADSVASYNLKVVTERGNISTFQVSPNTSTRIQLILPGEVQPGEDFRVVTLITNNSTLPNNIANLVPIIKNNSTLTQIDGPLPPSIKSLPQGNTATFTSTYVAPSLSGGIGFNATYVGAPTNTIVNSNMTVALSAESEAATQSQWSQAASRVGILISGIPNPIDSTQGGAAKYSKWGIGIINPIDRPVEVYAVSITAATKSMIGALSTQSTNEGWAVRDLGSRDSVVREFGSSPTIIPAKSVYQFKTEFDLQGGSSSTIETDVIISALTSEGKLSTRYDILTGSSFPLINAFYTTNTSEPETYWTYILSGLKGGTNYQFNATIQNLGSAMASKVTLLILIPRDFNTVTPLSSAGWDAGEVVDNPDGSHIIKVTTNADFAAASVKTFKFTADTPVVTDDKLYVFQTTTIYPTFCCGTGKTQVTSALSEAGVEISP